MNRGTLSPTQEVAIDIEGHRLHGGLTVPEQAQGLVVFAHGSGSSRHSPRNRSVARTLQEKGLATLLFDLLTEEEETGERRGGRLRFDVAFLADRLAEVVRWAEGQERLKDLPVGVFGSSTGGGAALVLAAREPHRVRTAVSRGGRPDLAGEHLAHVRCPVLLIVGGADPVVLGMNRQALEAMSAPVRLEVVEGATHLFEEPGALDEVARLAADWCAQHLGHEGA